MTDKPSSVPTEDQDLSTTDTTISAVVPPIRRPRAARRQLAPLDQFPSYSVPDDLRRSLEKHYATFESDK